MRDSMRRKDAECMTFKKDNREQEKECTTLKRENREQDEEWIMQLIIIFIPMSPFLPPENSRLK